MAEKVQGIIAQIKNEGINQGISQGISQGEGNIIRRLLEKYSVEEVSVILEMKVSEILEIVDGK